TSPSTRAVGCGGRLAAPVTRPAPRRSRSGLRAPARACPRPSRRRRALRRRCDAQRLCRLLQPGEVEACDRLRDELAVALGIERATDDARRRLEREVRNLGADLLERARGLRRDLF